MSQPQPVPAADLMRYVKAAFTAMQAGNAYDQHGDGWQVATEHHNGQRTHRVVVVCDRPITLHLLIHILERNGYVVHSSSSNKQRIIVNRPSRRT